MMTCWWLINWSFGPGLWTFQTQVAYQVKILFYTNLDKGRVKKIKKIMEISLMGPDPPQMPDFDMRNDSCNTQNFGCNMRNFSLDIVLSP